MTNAAIDIPNLLYRYAEAFDDGDFIGAARLFDRGCVTVGDKSITGVEAITALWRQWVRLYDGKPRTRHITTNPIIEIADDGQSATCRSQWTLIQATEDFAMQLVGSGRYQDVFALIDGAWHFAERTYGQVDMAGDTSAHTRQPLVSQDR